jgi:alpha-glucosidase
MPATTSTTTTSTTTTTLVPNECTVGRAPVGIDGDGFFTQGCQVLGIDVVASGDVAAEALTAAAERFYEPLVRLPHLVSALQAAGITIAVIGADEVITDLPPLADIYRQYPGTDWRRTGRSFAATQEVRWLTGAEENLLCAADGDRYSGEDMFLRELARTLRDFGLRAVAEGIDEAIEQSYNRAVLLDGRWDDTLAENNSDTYWMEAVQSFFDANREADPPDAAHNHVDTREELQEHDPLAYELAVAVFGDIAWRGPCGR